MALDTNGHIQHIEQIPAAINYLLDKIAALEGLVKETKAAPAQAKEVEYLTAEQCAKKLQISENHLRDLTKEGVIKGRRLGGTLVRYTAADIDNALIEIRSFKADKRARK